MFDNSQYFLVISIKIIKILGHVFSNLKDMADKTNNSRPKVSFLLILLRETTTLLLQLIKLSSFLTYLSSIISVLPKDAEFCVL